MLWFVLLCFALFDCFCLSFEFRFRFRSFLIFLIFLIFFFWQVYDIRRTTYIEISHVRRLLDAIYGADSAKWVDVGLAWLFRVAR